MIKEKYYPIIAPISSQHAYKITKPQDSKAVNGLEYEWFVFGKPNHKRSRKAKNIHRDRKIFEEMLRAIKPKTDIIPMIEAKHLQDDFLEEERKNIRRVSSADKSSSMGSPLLLSGDG